MQDGSTFKLIIDQISSLTIPIIFFAIVGFAMLRKVKVYESFVEGGKEGFDIFIKILPYIVAILVAIGVFRESGALKEITRVLSPYTEKIGLPAEVLPVALMKPLSGTGSLGLVTEIVQDEPDSFNAKLASTMFGSTDTTFYIIALYFGSVGIRKVRQAMIAGLLADLAGILAAIWISHVMFS